ncbi:hypothetical protein [Roseateles sp. P5_D6]
MLMLMTGLIGVYTFRTRRTTLGRRIYAHHRSPVQALQAWQVSKPHLFKHAVYKQAGLDT